MMKIKKRYVVVSALVMVLLWGMTAITHTYGPYMGKVVAAKTGEPIEGAVVFLLFTTYQPNPGGTGSKVADAVEILTGKDGEFNIPAHRIILFRFLQIWEDDNFVKIFKPGYGVFPNHEKSKPQFKIWYSFPENTYVTVELPKLRYEERLDNLDDLYIPHSDQIPLGKRKLILELNNTERMALGLGPETF